MTAHGQIPIIWRLPTTDIFGTLVTAQGDLKCRDFEMRAMDCMAAYGHSNTEKCSAYLEDLQECLFSYKEHARVVEMRNERLKRRIREGSTGEPYYQKMDHGDSYNIQNQ